MGPGDPCRAWSELQGQKLMQASPMPPKVTPVSAQVPNKPKIVTPNIILVPYIPRQLKFCRKLQASSGRFSGVPFQATGSYTTRWANCMCIAQATKNTEETTSVSHTNPPSWPRLGISVGQTTAKGRLPKPYRYVNLDHDVQLPTNTAMPLSYLSLFIRLRRWFAEPRPIYTERS